MDSSSGFKNTDSPLLIEIVVESVFRNLAHDDLHRCIGVCKSWKQLALREFMIRNQILNITDPEGMSSVLRTISTDKTRGARYARIIFRNVQTGSVHSKNLISYSFNFITTLVLYSCTATPEDFREMLGNLPNLRDLGLIRISSLIGKIKPFQLFPIYADKAEDILTFNKLRRLQFQSICYVLDPAAKDMDSSATITYLSDAFRTFPFLKDVAVMDLAVEDPKNFECLRPYSVKKLSIKASVFSDGLSDQILEMLNNMKLSLEHFDIKMHPASAAQIPFGLDPLKVNTKLLRNFVESQASTLVSLELFQVNELGMAVPNPSFCPFPFNLPNLKFLEIHRAFVKDLEQIINNLPNLTEARFWFSKETSWTTVLPNVLKQHGNLKTLRIQHVDGNSLSKLLKCFPSLNSLQIVQCTLEVVRVLGQFFAEFKCGVRQEYEKDCKYCLDKKVYAKPEKMSFWNQDSVNGLSISTTLPDLKRIFLRKCKHVYFYFLAQEEGQWPRAQAHLTPTEIYNLNMFERPDGVAFRSQTWMEPEPGSEDLEFVHTFRIRNSESGLSY